MCVTTVMFTVTSQRCQITLINIYLKTIELFNNRIVVELTQLQPNHSHGDSDSKGTRDLEDNGMKTNINLK